MKMFIAPADSVQVEEAPGARIFFEMNAHASSNVIWRLALLRQTTEYLQNLYAALTYIQSILSASDQTDGWVRATVGPFKFSAPIAFEDKYDPSAPIKVDRIIYIARINRENGYEKNIASIAANRRSLQSAIDDVKDILAKRSIEKDIKEIEERLFSYVFDINKRLSNIIVKANSSDDGNIQVSLGSKDEKDAHYTFPYLDASPSDNAKKIIESKVFKDAIVSYLLRYLFQE